MEGFNFIGKIKDLRTLPVGILIFAVCVNLSWANDNGDDVLVIQPKAEVKDSDDEGFAKSIWGAYLFSLLGITAFVIICGFIIHYLSRPARSPTTSISNPNFRFPQSQRDPEPQPSPMIHESRFNPTILSTQQKPSPPLRQSSFISPALMESPKSAAYPQQQYQPYSGSSPLRAFSPPPKSPRDIGFINIPPNTTQPEKTVSETETTISYNYLGKWGSSAPASSIPPSTTNEESIIPKRAVLRTNTPYKYVEDNNPKIDGESEEGFDTPMTSPKNASNNNSTNYSYQNHGFNNFPENYQQQAMYPKMPKNNEGLIDSRFVRVLPRYPPSPPSKPSHAPTVGFHI